MRHNQRGDVALRDLLMQAKQVAASGVNTSDEAVDAPCPAELSEALKADPELADAFARLTPG
jgi:uncharacterized protein YdeI (YjbR/CyaY-like superfamily)